MRIVFFGSAPIGFPSLKALLASRKDEVVAVLTQPDRPAGRRQKLTPCAVKTFALEQGLPVLSPGKVKDSRSDLSLLEADLFIVVAYGQYIPQDVLSLPHYGAINLHPSLLPKYRGSSPIQWAVANGDRITGVTILYVSDQMDAGDVLLQKKIPIAPEETSETLEPVLAEEGAALLMQAVEQIRSGTAAPVPQDESTATEVRKLTKEDGRLDWTLSAETLRNRIRGFAPWPGCFCTVCLKGKIFPLKILQAEVVSQSGKPGEVLSSDHEPVIAAGREALRLLEVQPPGKRAMSGAAWLRGNPLQPGTCLPG